MGPHAARLWQTWADYIHEWCQRPDFRELLPVLLQGEDPGFQDYIRLIAAEEADPTSGEPRTVNTAIALPVPSNRYHHRRRARGATLAR